MKWNKRDLRNFGIPQFVQIAAFQNESIKIIQTYDNLLESPGKGVRLYSIPDSWHVERHRDRLKQTSAIITRAVGPLFDVVRW